MIRLVEIEGKMNEKGCIEIPAVVLEQTDIRTGESVKLIYLAEAEELQNESREFILLRENQEMPAELIQPQEITFQIPQELLADAGIPLDADLDIVCRDKRIIILPAEPVSEVKIPDELTALCRELGISEDKVNIILKTAGEEADEEDSV